VRGGSIARSLSFRANGLPERPNREALRTVGIDSRASSLIGDNFFEPSSASSIAPTPIESRGSLSSIQNLSSTSLTDLVSLESTNTSSKPSSVFSRGSKRKSILSVLSAAMPSSRKDLINAAKVASYNEMIDIFSDETKVYKLDQECINEALIEVARIDQLRPHRLRVVELLLNQGAQLEYLDQKDKRTALMWAICHQHEDIARLLISRGANLGTRDGVLGFTSLTFGIWYAHDTLVTMLLDCQVDMEEVDPIEKRTPLMWVVARERTDLLEKFLLRRPELETTDETGMTALSLAFQRQDEPCIDMLLKHGARGDCFDTEGFAVLLLTVAENDCEAASKLLAHGASTECYNSEGAPATCLAAWMGHHEVLEVLLAWGANPESRDARGQTALCIAAHRGHSKVIEVLLNANADIEAYDYKRFRTPLHWAVGFKHRESVILLLDRGANRYAIDGAGISVADWAVDLKDSTLMDLVQPP
jgi:ankyrin repeat protein